MALADLDGDGDLDALTSSTTATATDQLGVLEQTPGGLVATGTAGPPSTLLATDVVAGDLDGDGLPDVATADAAGDTISLLRNASAPAPHAVLGGAFATQDVGSTGAPVAVTVTNAGAAPLAVAGVATVGDAADDFLVSSDGCTGRPVASGGAASCTVRLRFAPSAPGARTAALRLRLAGGGTYDVGLAGTGAEGEGDDAGGAVAAAPAADATAATTPAAAATDPTASAAPSATTASRPGAKPKRTRLILTLSHSKLTAGSGAPVGVGLALGRAARVVLRVKHGGRTVEVVRVARRGGLGSVIWDGRLGSEPAPPGRYRLDIYAVAADGRAARGSVALTIKPRLSMKA